MIKMYGFLITFLI